MTFDERMRVFDILHNEELKVLSAKGADYAGNEDALRNFKINAERLGLTKYQIWAVYTMKHIDAILNSIERNPKAPTRQAETIVGSILDGRNYLGLLACMIAEDEGHIYDGEHGTMSWPWGMRTESSGPQPCDHSWYENGEGRTLCMRCGQQK